MTVKELIVILSQYNDNQKVYLSLPYNDDDDEYIYQSINHLKRVYPDDDGDIILRG